MPEISIIVPVYKVEAVLSRCLDSILCQTFADFELLLIDDGSPDNSGKICDEYAQKDARIRVFHKENGGVSSARNLGLDQATGKYIMFCDSDDTVDPTWAEKMRETISQDGVFIGIGAFRSLYQKRDFVSVRKLDFDSVIPCSQYFDLICTKTESSVCNKIFISDLIDQNHLRFDSTISYGEDAIFVCDYLALNKGLWGICNEVLYTYYREYNVSLTQGYIPAVGEFFLRLFDRKEELFSEFDVDMKEHTVEYADMLLRYIRFVFRNYLSEKAPISSIEKIRQLKRVTKSNLYKKAVKDGTFKKGWSTYKFVMKSRSALLIFLFDKLIKQRENAE